MKIFYICSSGDSTAYARSYLPGMFLRELGHEVNFNIQWQDQGYFDVEDIDQKKAPEMAARNVQLAKEADLIVMQRPGNITHLAEMHRLRVEEGKPVIVEHDDLFTEIPDKSPFSVYKLDTESYNLCVMGASQVTTTTDYLKRQLEKSNPRVTVIPNGLDLSRYIPQSEPHEKFRIGLIGSASFADNQQVIDIKEIAGIPNVQIVVFGLPAKEDMIAAFDSFKKVNAEKIYQARLKQYKPYEGIENIEFHDYVSTADYPAKLASLNLDLAIIPRENSSFNKAKSNIKYVELSALKVPTVCQHFLDNDSPYDIDQAQTDQQIMLRAGWGFPSFKEQIEKLINDKELRLQIAENAYQYIQTYDIRNTVLEWEKTFQKVVGTTD